MRNSSLIFIALLLMGCNDSDIKKGTSPQVKKETDELPKELPYNALLTIETHKFNAENCDVPMMDEMEYSEDWCNRRTVKLLHVNTKNPEIADRINALIARKITGNKGGTGAIQKYVNEVKRNAGEMEDMAQEDVACSVIDSSNLVLSFGIDRYYFAYGAAHGSSTFEAINFDLRSGNQILLTDLFYDEDIYALTKLAKSKFINQNGRDGWWFTTDEQPFELPKVFSLSPRGITFYFQEYEVGPYAAGRPTVKISKESLKGLIRENPYMVFEEPNPSK